MLTRLRLLCTPPRFDDEFLDLRARLVCYISLLIFGFNVFLFISRWNTSRLAISIIGLTVPLFCLYLLSQRRVILASRILVLIFWAVVTSSVVVTGGIRSPSLIVHLSIVLIAAVLLSEWWAVAMLAADVLVLMVVFIAESQGSLVVIEQSAFTGLILYISGGVIATALIFVIARSIRQSIARMYSAQRQYRTLFENATVPIITFDRENRVQLINKATVEILHGQPEDYIGKRMDEYLPAEVAAVYSAHMRQVLLTQQEGTFEEPVSLQQRDYWFLTTIQPIYDEHNQLVGAQMISQDITARKIAEQREQELRLAREKDQMIRELLGNISHDLKTPLTLINLSLDMLERFKDPERQHEKIQQIYQQTRLVEHFIQDMLELAQLENMTELHRMTTQVGALLAQVAQQLLLKAEAKQITLQQEISADLPAIEADADQLLHVFSNLVDNAVTYTPESGQVLIRATANPSSIVVEISDTGMGIDAEELPFIFERFYRSKSARTQLKGGSGLGLAIVKRILEMHHYTIEVQSKQGEGTTFRVSIPV